MRGCKDSELQGGGLRSRKEWGVDKEWGGVLKSGKE